MSDVLHFSCDFGGGISCSLSVNVAEFKRTKDFGKAQDIKWSQKPTAAILPVYNEWMKTVLCQVADAVDGKILYALPGINGKGTVEVWIYEPRGKYYPADCKDRMKKTVKNLRQNPSAEIHVPGEKYARSVLFEMGLLDRFQESGLPGREVQFAVSDALPSHFMIAMKFSGFPEMKDNGMALRFLPRSDVRDLVALRSGILSRQFEYERDGVRMTLI